MGWNSTTTVFMGSPYAASNLFRVANQIEDGETFGAEVPEEARALVNQDRAYSSPVWYTPRSAAR